MKRLVIGPPLRSSRAAHERLSNPKALAVLSSDALSSVAYGTEETLLVLALAGSAALSVGVWVGVAIAVLMAIVGLSYRQTVFAYPSGGGSYIVAKDNLGTYPGLTAAAALLIDYVLTVAVSIASGVAAITSAFPALYDHRTLLCLVAIWFVTLTNLRGVRESGSLFAAPTYVFVGCIYLLEIVGLFKYGVLGHAVPPLPALQASHDLTIFLILRAFASGCTAMTGVEAISNGIPVFHEPESPNAAKTLGWMIGILITSFMGVALLAHMLHIVPDHAETVLSQIGRLVFGHQNPIYYLIQASTALILMLAANTSFADFPRLSSLVAKDGFLPRQLANRGDRLVYSNGIVVLGVLASILVIIFGGDTHALIPLYAVGVFLSFTLSQSGMVVHWHKLGLGQHWHNVVINGLGAITTGVILVVIGITKFALGAWVVILLIPVLVLMFRAVHSHYESVADQLRLNPPYPEVRTMKHHVVVAVSGVTQAVAHCLDYALAIGQDVHAVHVVIDPKTAQRFQQRWKEWNPPIPLQLLPSPYRSVLRPIVHYVEKLQEHEPDAMVTVLIPEFVPRKWWHHLLHNQSALLLKTALLFRRGVVVVSMPYHLQK